ncbi:hypothetical protein DF185_15220 [Marinifilum breve]|uniref:PocR domain-containing protein n=1 Tax=Marinifilum breve TaxID=2184082 RepID=A0A2V3ZV09_9BACT|nr:hypothetical protein DF185_15220 [Marinifilum breve]
MMRKTERELRQEISDLKQKNQQLQEQIDSLQRINESEIKDDHFTFSDLINTKMVQELMDQFYTLTGYPIGIIDVEHNILVATGWQPICTDFYRINQESCQLCHESDLFIQNHLQEGRFVEYKCKTDYGILHSPLLLMANTWPPYF